MPLYVVTKKTDVKPEDEYGIAVKFSLIFASTDRDEAEEALLVAQSENFSAVLANKVKLEIVEMEMGNKTDVEIGHALYIE